MSGEKRRENLLKILRESEEPVSGTKLAENFHVSRQVVVQDIALLRAKNHNIISTHKGYVLQEKGNIQRVFKVKHSEEKLLDELNLIVDLGGQVEDVFVYHKLYGVIRVEMNVKSRKDAKKYVEGIYGGVSVPLEQITSEYHYHTVTADATETLDEIQEELQKQGYLVALRDYEPVDFWSGV
jgi:transcriptional regulator of NAD metabolism